MLVIQVGVGLVGVGLIGAGLVACSGSSPSDLFEPVADGPSATEPAPSEPSPGMPPSIPTQPPPSPTDPGTKPTEPPPAACTQEIEPNSRASRSTLFKACLTGALDGWDIDYGRIVAPANAKAMTVQHDEKGGAVQYQIFAGSRLLASFTDEAPEMGISPGETYLFRIRAAREGGKGDRSYEVRVTFDE